jgi:cyanophycin synthetase
MARHAGGRIAYFTLEGGPEMSPFLQRHVAEGGLLVAREPSVRGGDLVIHDRGERTFVIHGDEIPATMGGLANSTSPTPWPRSPPATPWAPRPNRSPPPCEGSARVIWKTRAGSTSTTPTASGSSSTTRTTPRPCERWTGWSRRLRPSVERVIGVVSIPGDRRDEDILEMGTIAAGMFDDLIFREHPDGRGRANGSVVSLLSRGAIEAGFPPQRVQRILSETKSVDAALRMARPGDLVLLFPTSVDAVWAR